METAPPRSLKPTICPRTTPPHHDAREPAFVAWEIVRRHGHYRGVSHHRRTIKTDPPCILIETSAPPNSWGLCFRRGSHAIG